MHQRIALLRFPFPAACIAGFVSAASFGCSSDYAIGDLSERSLPVDGEPTASAESGSTPRDFQLDPLLAPPDVTMTLNGDRWDLIKPLGDVDADGFDDFAQSVWDNATSAHYVHLRYGGPRPRDAVEAFSFGVSGALLTLPEGATSGAVDAVGDLDGDGHADLIVTTGRCTPLQPIDGAYLIYGSAERLDGLQPIADVAVFLPLPPEPEPAEPGCLGGSAPDGPDTLGDIDGDGFDDFMLRDVHVPYSVDPFHPTEEFRTTLSLFYGRGERFESGTSWADADARLHAKNLVPNPNGDVTGDGRADVLLTSEVDAYLWLPGSAERLSGDVAATSSLQKLVCTPACVGIPIAPAGDVDGDGVGDLLAFPSTTQASLFYGGPGLLDAGIDFSQAAATFDHAAALPYHDQPLMAAGDRDGDGDSDLFAHFYSDPNFVHTDVAFASGSAERLNGAITLPVQDVLDAHPNGPELYHPERAIQKMYVAGDLDGDGSSDMISVSSIFIPVAGAEPGAFDYLLPQLHIHYGTPGGVSPSPVR